MGTASFTLVPPHLTVTNTPCLTIDTPQVLLRCHISNLHLAINFQFYTLPHTYPRCLKSSTREFLKQGGVQMDASRYLVMTVNHPMNWTYPLSEEKYTTQATQSQQRNTLHKPWYIRENSNICLLNVSKTHQCASKNILQMSPIQITEINLLLFISSHFTWKHMLQISKGNIKQQ